MLSAKKQNNHAIVPVKMPSKSSLGKIIKT